MDPAAMQRLHQQVTEANTRAVSALATLEVGRQRVVGELQRVLTKIGWVAEARERKTDPEFHKRVLEKCRAGKFDALSVREQRYAAKQFTEVSAACMQRLLHANPGNWPAFAQECFRRWGTFNRVSERAGYARLLCLAPESVRFLHQLAHPPDLVAASGPAALAKSLQAHDLDYARLALQQRGFGMTWSFTSLVLANWVYLRSHDQHSFSMTWHAVMQDRTLEAMLLPPVAGKATSWFSAEARPARIRRSLDAYATFVAALIRAYYATGVEPAHWSSFTENLLRSTFGDPRVALESKGWAKLKERDEPAYQRFLELLITEDITVFFDHAMKDPRRKAFWLQYLKSVRRTVCILDRSTHERLKRQLSGADQKLAAAISRAHTFTAKTSGAHAFCLYFDSFVVVEFSETGNAAQIYSRDYFQKRFEHVVYADQCRDHTALKTPMAAQRRDGIGERILHVGPDWEANAQSSLRTIGIQLDRKEHGR